MLGNTSSVTYAKFPAYIEKFTIENTFEYPVSFNGKLRFKLELDRSLSAAEIEAAVRSDENTLRFLSGGGIKKIIVVPGKIINVVC